MDRLGCPYGRKRLQVLVPLACLLLAAPIGAAGASALSIKGLDPALAEYYRPQSGNFACLDRSTSVAFDRVNDNFCDCIDGTDEPGTSACPNGHFYCRNRGHQPLLLNSSSVDDRICDCCDGSDEAPGVCKNTCAEAGAANRAALKARAAAYKQGLKARSKYVKDAVTHRQKWGTDVQRLAEEEAALTKVVGRLQAKKARIEKQEAREREREEAARKLAEEQEAAAKAAEPASTEEAEQSEPAAAAGDSSSSQESGQESEEELSEEEKGRRIAAQWTHDPEAVGETQQASAEQPGAESAAAEAAAQEVEAAAAQVAEEVQEEIEEEEEPPTPQGGLAAAKAWVLDKLGFAGVSIGNTNKQRQQIKDDYFAKNTQLTEIARQKAELEGRLKTDFGPEDAFLPLIDRCFEAKVEKYVYEVCPFKSAAQKDGGLSTSLGSWQGFEDGPTLVFSNGQHCWNGPNRSLRVALECGSKEEVSAVEEPSRCEYRAKMTTPAACTRDAAASVEHELKAAEMELSSKDELRRL